MKISFLLFSLFGSQICLAGIVNLNIGESINLDANTTMTVTCGANGACALPVKNLKTKLDYCKAQVNSNVDDCIQENWPEFIKKNPRCVEDGLETCLNFCKTSVLTLECLDICR